MYLNQVKTHEEEQVEEPLGALKSLDLELSSAPGWRDAQGVGVPRPFSLQDPDVRHQRPARGGEENGE